MAARNPFLSSPDAKESSSADPNALSVEDWMRMALSNDDESDEKNSDTEMNSADNDGSGAADKGSVPRVSIVSNDEDEDNLDISTDSAAMFESMKLLAQASRQMSDSQNAEDGSEADGGGQCVEAEDTPRDLYSSSDSDDDSGNQNVQQQSDDAPPIPDKPTEDVPPPRPPRSTLTVSSPPIVPRRVHQISQGNNTNARRSSTESARGHRRYIRIILKLSLSLVDQLVACRYCHEFLGSSLLHVP
eukprot:m.329171 g.329171  ORF g.329171 m.329171 type:complete len:245 (-) comp20441_c0_seq1:749-1483(-)